MTAHPIILLLGPTAGGKTRLAIDLAGTLPGGGECICADSMQVYRGMDIGTAKPTAEERAAVPHHLLDVVDPSDDGFTVDTWLALAEEVIEDVRARGCHPIVVGGTNLYIQALLKGLCDGPAPEPRVRDRLGQLDESALHARLRRVDPVAADRIHPNDRRRMIRALEVQELSGQRLSDLQQQWDRGVGRTDVRIIGLEWPVETINRRINARVKAMVAAGLVAEVEGLWRGGQLGVQARSALGYQQIIEHLEGRCSLEEAVEQIKIRTRRFAKQQRTWLRKFRIHPESTWIPAGDIVPQDTANKSLKAILHHPDSGGQNARFLDQDGAKPQEDS